MPISPKLIFYALIVLAIITLFGLWQYQIARTKKFKEISEDRESAMNVKEREWRSKSGKLVHENTVIKIQSKEMAKEIFKKDSFLRDLGIKWKDVHSLSKSPIHNHYHITTPVINNGDSTYKIKEWTNRFLTINGEIDLKKNKADLDYLHLDTLKQVITYKQKRFLGIIPHGKITFTSEVTMADSASKVTDQTTYVRQK